MAPVVCDERKEEFSVEKEPKAKRVSKGRVLGKRTTPGEPVPDKNLAERREKYNKYAQLALSDYNENHGTDLVLLKVEKFETHVNDRGHTVDFRKKRPQWIHINLEAKRQNDDASDKSLHLFSEQYHFGKRPVLTRLLLLPPADNLHGCSPWPCEIRIPFHQFRAGFDDDCPVKKLSSIQTRSMECAWNRMRAAEQGYYSQLAKRKKQEQDSSEFAKNALRQYNAKHGTKLEFVRALGCQNFVGTGLSMDFTENERIWKHMNFVARRPDGEESFEELLLFAELYLGDDYNHVLATLSIVDPEFDKATVCTKCPSSFLHPSFKCFN